MKGIAYYLVVIWSIKSMP